MVSIPAENLQYYIDHVFLPPKLPQEAEGCEHARSAEQGLLCLLHDFTKDFQRSQISEEFSAAAWKTIERMVECWIGLSSTPSITNSALLKALAEIRHIGVIAVPIRAQNALLLIRRSNTDIIFQCCEVLPKSEAVIKGNLIRTFPACALAIPYSTFARPDFRKELAQRLCSLDGEVIEEMMPQSHKAGSTSGETRDSVHPGLVTEMLMPMLAPLGHPVQVRQVRKRTRDDVLWKNADLPWRRSALWLSVRVALQMTLVSMMPSKASRIVYKNILILFMTRIGSLVADAQFESDLLQVVKVKLARRVFKLGTGCTTFVHDQALEVCERLKAIQHRRWQEIVDHNAKPHTKFKTSSFSGDTLLALNASSFHLQAILTPSKLTAISVTPILPQCPIWLDISDDLPRFSGMVLGKRETHFVVFEFERWVSEYLPHWLKSASKSPSSAQCMELWSLSSLYHKTASTVYDRSSEGNSIMLLVIAELWRALDVLATKIQPLLGRFGPGIPLDLFSPLLLPKRSQMDRLRQIEMYIDVRRQQAVPENPSMFSDPSKRCFAAQLYEASENHQTLRREIDEFATKQISRKRTEWILESQRYREITDGAKAMVCQNTFNMHRNEKRHILSACPRCSALKAAENMSIDRYERPLPEDAVHCAAAVVELDFPFEMVAWRNMTWMLVHDIGRSSKTPGSPPAETLLKYSGLQLFARNKASGISIASVTKSYTRAHYKEVKFPVEFEKCVVNNALRYRLWDAKSSCWLHDQESTPSIDIQCITQLPEGPYTNLQYAVDATSHTQNRVIAEQGSCSADLTLPEFISFGSLRADGERIQWLNIKRELGSSNLDFNAEAVSILFRQAAWQAGSYNNTPYRNTHMECGNKAFCHELLSILERNVESIKANWKSDNALLLFTTITLRILSLSPRPDIKTMAVGLLQKVRGVAYTWTEMLDQMIHQSTARNVLLRLQQRRLRSAILCKMTFDVDASDLPKLLATANDVCTWILCSNTVQEDTGNNGVELKRDLHLLLLRDKRLSHRLFRHVRTLVIQGNQGGLNKAIRHIWSGFEPTSAGWKALRDPSLQRWIVSFTEAKPGKASQQVLYDLLEGELLVDGVPLGRLSRMYTESESYLRILGAQLVRVFRADMEGMHYMSAQPINGYIVYFGVREKDVRIRFKQGSQIWELVSHRAFSQDLPSAFITDYTHWLDIENREVEFRSNNNPWKSSPENWLLMYRKNAKPELVQGKRKLVDVQSKTFAAATKMFGALDEWQHIHVTLVNDIHLKVALPRLDLHFSLNAKGDMECHELRKIVDPDQSLGTLIGLRSRLILCGSGAIARNHDRLLIIPEGEINVSRSSSHVQVNISARNNNARIFRYHIDASLQCLRRGPDRMGNLYIAYLHALTSHILPDPFTNLTGTEQALQLLRLNSMSLSKPATCQELLLLTSIAALTPTREYYPSHLKAMQSVNWNSRLSMFTQHDDFLPLAERILTSGNRYADFYPEAPSKLSLRERFDQGLLTRAQIRHSSHRSSEFGGHHWSTEYDSVYQARDVQAPSDRAHRVHEIASLIVSWPRKLEVSRDIGRELCHHLGKITNLLLPFDSSIPLSELLALSMNSSWAPLHNTCRSSSRETDTYKLLFLLSTIAYGISTSTTTLKTLLAFAFVPELRETCHLPKHSTYSLTDGTEWDEPRVRQLVRDHLRSVVPPSDGIRDEQYTRRPKILEKQRQEQLDDIVNEYGAQWSRKSPAAPDSAIHKHFDVHKIHPKVVALFSSWSRNMDFDLYLQKVYQILAQVYERAPSVPYVSWQRLEEKVEIQEPCNLPILAEVMVAANEALQYTEGCELGGFTRERTTTTAEENPRLRKLVKGVKSKHRANHRGSVRDIYSDDLLASLDALNRQEFVTTPMELPFSHLDTLAYYIRCLNVVANLSQSIGEALSLSHANYKILQAAGLWPRVTTGSLLAFLSTSAPRSVIKPWKASVLTFGKAITKLQRARRLLLASERGDVSTFCGELDNDGHNGWEVERWPDWLLIEIENDFLIRPVQARVALAMIQPSTAANSLVQLNMGEGKSSVIIPLVAAAIANGSRLSRVIVLKSLSNQMADTLFQRLGGLVDRQVFFMPFSRKVETKGNFSLRIQGLLDDCVSRHGILLSQPEHILSFKLMGIERLTSGDFGAASRLIKIQKWLDDKARDILDESDEILDVKFQLIYTLGTQRMMDGQPERWLLIQGIFDLVDRHACELRKSHPASIEVHRRSEAAFPTIRLLTSDIGRLLTAAIVRDIRDGHLPDLTFMDCPPHVREAMERFLQEVRVSAEDVDIIRDFLKGSESRMKNMLLVRGLIAHNVLLFVLRSKRWLVNYGLHPTRCLTAVPYHAKGIPAPSAEFGHPDVAIALTCLTYYYTGLSDAQIRTSIELLRKEDDPSLEYQAWIRGCHSLPTGLRDWVAVNLEDEQQCLQELFPALRYSKKAADFFMSRVVFPKEGKEFDERLSTSGWDIPSPPNAKQLTTGFSGTNDNRFLLPLTIHQHELPQLQHTSGKVLDYVLRQENLGYHCVKDEAGGQLFGAGLLRVVMATNSAIRVLIDVGAQVLDLQNRDLVSAWLDICPQADAGVYFDDEDNIMVLTRDQKIEKLSSSSFLSRLDRCVVYLDEVHTRGTDLKLPLHARAALTLGPRLTKDRLVQACMRLRKLAHGQCLVFFAPPEVHQNIIDVTGRPAKELTGYDVVAWSLEQSCLSIERSQPLRVIQGICHQRRQHMLDTFFGEFSGQDDLAKDVNRSKKSVKKFREKEEQTLQDLYGPTSVVKDVFAGALDTGIVRELKRIWRNLDSKSSAMASMHEEHEREVAPEIEKEVAVQRPQNVTPLEPLVDSHLRTFIFNGNPEEIQNFANAFASVLIHSSAKEKDAAPLWVHINVTRDFANTVEISRSGVCDDYFRPVNWVLTSKLEASPTFFLLISQHEVNELLNDIRSPSSAVHLHQYEPRVTKSMQSVDGSKAPTLDSSFRWRELNLNLRQELHLFAGQLYFNSYADYRALLEKLNTASYVAPEKLLSFIKAWLAIRRKGHNFLQSHMGQMVSGRLLQEEAFE